jgi:hypothetical protein
LEGSECYINFLSEAISLEHLDPKF